MEHAIRTGLLISPLLTDRDNPCLDHQPFDYTCSKPGTGTWRTPTTAEEIRRSLHSSIAHVKSTVTQVMSYVCSMHPEWLADCRLPSCMPPAPRHSLEVDLFAHASLRTGFCFGTLLRAKSHRGSSLVCLTILGWYVTLAAPSLAATALNKAVCKCFTLPLGTLLQCNGT